MTASRWIVAAVLVAGAWFGRGLVASDADPDVEPFVPVARIVELDPTDLDWQPRPDGRDPFVPLVLPSVEATDGAVE